MTRKPDNVSWLGFDKEQRRALDTLDQVANNGWDRNGQSDELLPALLGQAERAHLPLAQIKDAIRSVG